MDDVGVAYAAGDLGFPMEAGKSLAICGQLASYDLHGYALVQSELVALVHRTHPPFTKKTGDAVGALKDCANERRTPGIRPVHRRSPARNPALSDAP
jgi:hypothetical protein